MASEHGIYQYAPSKPACILAAGLFGLSALYHSFQLLRSRAWFYTSFVIGAWSKSCLYRGRNLLIFNSDDDRLQYALHLCWRYFGPGSIHNAVPLHNPATFTLRRHDLHDLRPTRPFRQRCRSFDYPANARHQGVCLRGCCRILYASWWRRHDGATYNDGLGAKDHADRPLRTNDVPRIISNPRNCILDAHVQVNEAIRSSAIRQAYVEQAFVDGGCRRGHRHPTMRLPCRRVRARP